MSDHKKIAEKTVPATDIPEATVPAEAAAAVEGAAAAPAEKAAPVSESPDAVLLAKLKAYGGDETVLAKLKELGVESVDDLSELTEKDLMDAGMKLVKARKMMADSMKAAPKAEPAPVAAAPMMSADWNMILPSPTTNESFLKALKAGGVLKIDDATYEAALRVFLADRCGLYVVPEKLASEMERFADESDEPVTNTFFKLKNSITRRNYSDLFAAIEGLDGSFASKKRRDEFIRRIRSEMCPAIREAYAALDGWYKSMLAASSNPAALLQAISGMMSGAGLGLGASVPPTDAVHDASDTLKDAINHVFRGTAAPVGAAMASDAMEISSILSDPTLPAMVGAVNREQMLKKLGINITPNYARLEQNLVRFVLSYIKFDEAGGGNEAAYLTALWTLGNQISWSDLGIATDSSTPTIGGRNYL